MKYAGASIERRRCRQVQVGSVPVGGDAPISVQTMTNTDTLDVASTLRQIDRIQAAGADMVRVSVPSLEAAESFRQIRSGTRIPLIADVHFDYRIALRVIELGADCLRINPGNIGRRERIAEVVSAAADAGTVLRIGVNAGSLEKDLQAKYGEPCPDALVESAMRQVDILDELGFDSYKLSIKASEVFMAVESYRRIARQIDAPLHLGITEAGAARAGTVKSAIGLGVLLMEGIGDTLRISLAADPVEEVKVGFELLKSLHLRTRGVNIIACPSCSRQNFDVIATVNELERRLEDITDPLELAVIGCYVNGPGESRAADIGVTGADPRHLMYVGGEPSAKLGTGELIDRLEAEVRARIEQNRREKTSGGDIPVQQQ